jgi:hypothetical protein
MDISAIWTLRLSGLAGILGSILFMAGDLLYNHVPGSRNSITMKMSGLPDSRLLTAGTLGLIGCWLYALASYHLFLAFRPVGELFAVFVFASFGMTMICYGVSHAAYFSIATGAKVAATLGSDVESGGKLGNIFFNRMVYITYIPVVISSLMMCYGIVSGKSMYPRWMVIFLPVIIYLLKIPVTRILKGRLKEIINDAYDNFVLFIFYIISTAVLWN